MIKYRHKHPVFGRENFLDKVNIIQLLIYLIIEIKYDYNLSLFSCLHKLLTVMFLEKVLHVNFLDDKYQNLVLELIKQKGNDVYDFEVWFDFLGCGFIS